MLKRVLIKNELWASHETASRLTPLASLVYKGRGREAQTSN